MSDAACPMEGVVESSDSQESATGSDPEVHFENPKFNIKSSIS